MQHSPRPQAAAWRTSSRRDQPHDECVEIAGFAGGVAFRDSTQGGQGPMLAITRAQARDLLTAIKQAR